MSPSDTYPIALACGFSRFDEVVPWKWLQKPGRDDFHYFKKIRSTLNAAGFRAFHTKVSWGAPLAVRASELGRELDSILALTGAPRLHIIAHSMGGLDARYAICALGYASKVASLTTIATPHHGSPLADLFRDPASVLRRLLARMYQWGIDLRGVLDLATAECETRNARFHSQEQGNSIVYQAYAGVAALRGTFLPLKLGHFVLRFLCGAPNNDGLVPLASAKWDDAYFRGILPWDHLNQLGWWTPARFLVGDTVALRFERNVRQFYVGVADGLFALQTSTKRAESQ